MSSLPHASIHEPRCCINIIAAVTLEDECLAKQSMDNMSIIVVAFRAAWEEGTLAWYSGMVTFIHLALGIHQFTPSF